MILPRNITHPVDVGIGFEKYNVLEVDDDFKYLYGREVVYKKLPFSY